MVRTKMSGTWVPLEDVVQAFKTAAHVAGHSDDDLLNAIEMCCPTRMIKITNASGTAQVTITGQDAGTGQAASVGPFVVGL